MLHDDIDFGTLLWPEPFKFRSFIRAKKKADTQPELWELYQKFFALFGNTARPPVPFSSAVPDLNSERPVFEPFDDLPLSVVVVTRNDLHVERMEERTQAFIDGILHLSECNRTKVELIIVEWNPPIDRKSFAEQFSFPEKSDFCAIKIVTVPTEIHNTYQWAGRLPLYQMIGKNVGIRRARGRHVLVTNIDVLLSPSLFKYITSPQRAKGYIYRSNRWDVDTDILDIKDSEAQLKAAPEKCFRVNYREGGLPIEDIHKKQEKTEAFDPEHMWYPDLHTEGCGDFQMLHRRDWYKVRGYTETDCFSYHIDSLFAFVCHFAGIKEMSLSDEYPHYHIDHTVGSAVNSDIYTIGEKQVIRHISCESIIALSSQMFHAKDFLVFNRANWGLSDHDLPTAAVTHALWEVDGNQKPYISDYLTDPTFAPLDSFPLLNCRDTEEGRLWLADCTNALGEYLNRFALNRDVYIWGYGKRGHYCKAALQTYTAIEVKGFVQSSQSLAADISEVDVPVYASDSLQWNSDEKPFIIVASVHADAIRQTLEQEGCVEGEDFLIWS